MRNLLSAQFSRLFRSRTFYLVTSLILALSVLVMLNEARQASVMKQSGYSMSLDSCYYFISPIMGLCAAVFISLFLGTEYSDGTIRNKLMVGHSRTDIYLANLIVCLAAGFFFTAAWLIGGLSGVPFLGLWKMGVQSYVLYALVSLFFMVSFASIFTLASTLSTNKAVTAVAVIILWLALLLVSSIIYNRLCEPKEISGIMMTANGMQMSDPTPNPNYVSGSRRTVYQWILDILPTGQGILMANTNIAHPLRNIICSALITLAATTFGVLGFQKKDLK